MVAPAEMTPIVTFPMDVPASDAEDILLDTDDEIATTTATDITYYPYQVYTFDLHADALLNEFSDHVACGVDLCNGQELFLEDPPTTTETSVPRESVVAPNPDSIQDPETIARHYLLELARKELRVGSPPDLTLVDDTRVHRPFHIVECETTDNVFLTYIVDGITGDFHRVYLE